MPDGLVDVIAAQQTRFSPCAVRERSVASLRDPSAMTVVTGQQVGLFGGPLYSLYKAATAVRLARDFAEKTGFPCVPVFWLQTEDHDFDEICRSHQPGDAGPRTLQLSDNLGPNGSQIPVRARRLGPVIDHLRVELSHQLSGLRFADDVGALICRHYTPDATLPSAFAGLFAELFAGTGLIILDPSDAALVPFAAPVHRHAFAAAEPIASALCSRVDELQAAGIAAQIHVRPDAPLSFWHRGDRDGPRFRVAPLDAESWQVCGTDLTVSRAEVAADLLDRPERFSTSALLRPVMQDVWLPTVAYVGGPGECAYFAQLAPLYEAFERPMPLVVPRASFALVDASARRLAEQLGLQPVDALQPYDTLLAQLGSRGGAAELDPDTLAAALSDPLHDQITAFAAHVRDRDPGLARAADKADRSISAQLNKLIDRYRRALGERDTLAAQRLTRLVGLLAPNGQPQERCYGFAAFAARAGPAALVERILSAADPWRHDLQWLDI